MQRAAALGFTPGQLEQTLQATRDGSDEPPADLFDPPPPGLDADLCTELTDQRSSFDRRHVLQALSGHAHAGATVTELETAADTLLAGELVVALGVGRFGLCYSTPELLALETRVLDQTASRQVGQAGVVADLAPTLFVSSGPLRRAGPDGPGGDG